MDALPCFTRRAHAVSQRNEWLSCQVPNLHRYASVSGLSAGLRVSERRLRRHGLGHRVDAARAVLRPLPNRESGPSAAGRATGGAAEPRLDDAGNAQPTRAELVAARGLSQPRSPPAASRWWGARIMEAKMGTLGRGPFLLISACTGMLTSAVARSVSFSGITSRVTAARLGEQLVLLAAAEIEGRGLF